jgi:hypothetical protein
VILTPLVFPGLIMFNLYGLDDNCCVYQREEKPIKFFRRVLRQNSSHVRTYLRRHITLRLLPAKEKVFSLSKKTLKVHLHV